MRNNGGLSVAAAAAAAAAEREEQGRKRGGWRDWNKVLESPGVDNAVSVINNHTFWDHLRTSSGMPIYNMQGSTSSGEMKDGWMNSAVGNLNANGVPNATSFASLQNYSSSHTNAAGKLLFQAGLEANSFPCGSFTRLLDPSMTLDCAEVEEYSESDKASLHIQHQQISSQAATVPLKLPTTFQSSNILTFHSNMSKLDMAGYPNTKPPSTTAQHQKYGGSPSDSSPSTSSSNNTLQKSAVDEGGECTTEQKRSSDQAGLSNSTFKKPRTEASTGAPMKVRKEKLGERITALQQLVSPFGKTDTASVLLEAMGYIKFLQEQVQVLSTPYLKGIPSNQNKHFIQNGRGDEQAKYDLRSRGLCLVPVSCTLHVANNNGADFWTSGLGGSSKF